MFFFSDSLNTKLDYWSLLKVAWTLMLIFSGSLNTNRCFKDGLDTNALFSDSLNTNDRF